MSIRLAEQVLLLLLNENSGKIYPQPNQYLDYAIIGALLIELAEKECVRLYQGVVKTLKKPTGEDPILQKIIYALPEAGTSEETAQCLNRLASEVGALPPLLLQSLLGKNILEQGTNQYLWFFKKMPEASYIDIKQRLTEILFHEQSPTESEALLIGIACACNLLSHLFTPEDLKSAEPRIRKLIRFEIINHVLSNALDEFQSAMSLELIHAPAQV